MTAPGRAAARAANRSNLLVGLFHGLVTAGLFAGTWHETSMTPPDPGLDPWLGLRAAVATPGILLVVLWVLTFLWHLLADAFTGRRPDAGHGSLRVFGGHLAFSLLAWGGLEVLAATLLEPVDFMVFIFGGAWVGSAAVAGLVVLAADARARRRGGPPLLDRSAPLPTVGLLASVAVPVWTVAVFMEVVFHRAATTHLPMGSINALLHGMSEEAEVMILGPEALRLSLIVAAMLALASTWALLRRRALAGSDAAPARRVRIAYAAVASAGLLAVFTAGERERKLLLHHVHPTVDDVALAFSPGLEETIARPDDDDLAAAAELYPDLAAVAPHDLLESYEPPSAPAAPIPKAGVRNVLLLFVDSLSMRHLECFGYEREVAPNLCALARESIVFDRARSTASQTDNATVSLFYSLLPLADLDKGRTYTRGHGGFPFHLALRDAGVRVGLFSGDWETRDVGFAPLHPERVDAFLDARGPWEDEARGRAVLAEWAGRPEEEVAERFVDWVSEAEATGRPWFGYFKALRPHEPYYTPPARPGWDPPFHPAADSYGMFDFRPWGSRVETLRNRYDNAVFYADLAFGRVLAHLREIGAWDHTAILFLADHGEAWGEHDLYGHGVAHYEEFLEVPLFLRVPGAAPGRDHRRVTTLDVGPTILDLAGLPPHPTHQGRSLLDPGHRPRVRAAFTSHAGFRWSIQVDEWKLAWNPVTGDRWLFDLAGDPRELVNLAWEGEHARRAGALRALLSGLARAQLDHVAALRGDGGPDAPPRHAER